MCITTIHLTNYIYLLGGIRKMVYRKEFWVLHLVGRQLTQWFLKVFFLISQMSLYIFSFLNSKSKVKSLRFCQNTRRQKTYYKFISKFYHVSASSYIVYRFFKSDLSCINNAAEIQHSVRRWPYGRNSHWGLISHTLLLELTKSTLPVDNICIALKTQSMKGSEAL